MSQMKKNGQTRDALLEAIESLNASRDHLMMSAELLREHLFNSDHVGRSAAVDIASGLINRARILDKDNGKTMR